MSSILSSDDLNDFISPGVACIKPIETLPAPPQPTDSLEVSFNTDVLSSDLPPAKISLTDCLACSGCVTSAEAILVSLQSYAEVLAEIDSAPALRISSNGSLENLDYGGRLYVASVSPQSRASLAVTFGVTPKEAGNMIEQLLSGPQGIKNRAVYRNIFQWIVDTNVAQDVCLALGAEEVMASMQNDKDPRLQNESSDVEIQKPILTSSCPGWICYAEKTHPNVLSHLSRLKSPQALLGTLLKTTLSRHFGISPDRIWHVAIMPCFDKKLEASREELTDVAWETGAKGIRDVDSVITSKELLMLAASRRIEFSKLPRSPVPRVPFPDPTLDSFLFPDKRRQLNGGVRDSGTSGGNLYYILSYFVSQNVGSAIKIARGRNADVLEYSVISSKGEVLLKAARYYGFRNIQNLVRRLKSQKALLASGRIPMGSTAKPKLDGKATILDYSYVEVMACPGGCTNGGGQVKVDDPIIIGSERSKVNSSPQANKEWLSRVDEAYFSDEDTATNDHVSPQHDISRRYIKDILAHWATTTGIDLKRLVYTTYREVISDVGKNIDPTRNIIDIAGKIGGGW